MSDNKIKTEYVIAIIGFIGVISAAVLGNFNNIFTDDENANVNNEIPLTDSIPDVVGLYIDDAKKKIIAKGFEIGKMEKKKIWAKDSYVITQNPKFNNRAKIDSNVDLIVADSEFEFQVERVFITKDSKIDVSTTYRVKRLYAKETESDVGQFVINNFMVDPVKSNETIVELLNRLRSKPGYMAINPKKDHQIDSSWEVMTELQNEMEKKMALEDITDSDQSGNNLGVAIILSMISIELNFDLMAIFSLAPEKGIAGEEKVELQTGSKMLSSIKVVGPLQIKASGTEYSYNVERRAINENEYKVVGKASYSALDKQLTRMQLDYKSDESTFYSLNIERR